MKQSCYNCRFFEHKPRPNLPDEGDCHRFPTITMVKYIGGCGEYKVKLTPHQQAIQGYTSDPRPL